MKTTPGKEVLPHLLAAHLAWLPILEYMLAQGVPVDLAEPTAKCTALHAACASEAEGGEEKLMPVVRLLVEQHHADVLLQTANGSTAADMAKRGGHRLVEAYLKDKEREQQGTAAAKLDFVMRLTGASMKAASIEQLMS